MMGPGVWHGVRCVHDEGVQRSAGSVRARMRKVKEAIRNGGEHSE